MKLIPILTEKSLQEAKNRNYTFLVEKNMDKGQIKKAVEDLFSVHVVRVRTVKKGGENKKNTRGYKRKVLPVKKAIVSLKEKEEIDLFETKK